MSGELLRGCLSTDRVVTDFVFKFGVEDSGIQGQRILLPVKSQLGIDMNSSLPIPLEEEARFVIF